LILLFKPINEKLIPSVMLQVACYFKANEILQHFYHWQRRNEYNHYTHPSSTCPLGKQNPSLSSNWHYFLTRWKLVHKYIVLWNHTLSW